MQHELELQRVPHIFPYMFLDATAAPAAMQKVGHLLGEHGIEMDAEQARTVPHFAAEHGRLAQHGIGRSRTAALFRGDGDAPFHAFFHAYIATPQQRRKGALQAQGRAMTADEQLRRGGGGHVLAVLRAAHEAVEQVRRLGIPLFGQPPRQPVLPFGGVQEMVEAVVEDIQEVPAQALVIAGFVQQLFGIEGRQRPHSAVEPQQGRGQLPGGGSCGRIVRRRAYLRDVGGGEGQGEMRPDGDILLEGRQLRRAGVGALQQAQGLAERHLPEVLAQQSGQISGRVPRCGVHDHVALSFASVTCSWV